MSIIVWRDVYATGINVLDNEHKKLIEQINIVYTAIRDKKGSEVVNDVLAALEQYTIDHFQHEEKLLTEFQYPDLEEHLAKHKELFEALRLKKEQAAADPDKMAAELLKFMREWLMNHILVTDKAYGNFLESRGGRFID